MHREGPPTEEELDVFRTEAERNRAEAAYFTAQTKGEELQNNIKELIFKQQEREDSIVRNTDIFNRVYDFRGKVVESSVRQCLGILSTWRRQSNDPITLVLDSPGGTVKDGLRLYDYIRFLAARDDSGRYVGPHDPSTRKSGIYVTTLAMGDTSSIAVAILQAGNRRVAAPSATLMIHEVSSEIGGTLSDINDVAKAIQRDQTRIIDILAERAKCSNDQLVEFTHRKAHYMDAQEAESLGLVDAIGYQ